MYPFEGFTDPVEIVACRLPGQSYCYLIFIDITVSLIYCCICNEVITTRKIYFHKKITEQNNRQARGYIILNSVKVCMFDTVSPRQI